MRILSMLALLLILTRLASAAPAGATAARVQLELVGEGQGSALLFQEWSQALGKAGLKNVRIRSAQPTDKVGVENRGTEASPLYVVTGVIKSRDELLLPGGRFSRRDLGRLAQWLDDLTTRGPAAGREEKTAFGLSPKQFDQVHEDLAKPVGLSTPGMARAQVVQKIGAALSPPLQVDPATAQATGDDKVAEDMSGLSSGTALACALRPAGLCLVPRQQGDRLLYAVVKAEPGAEIWPIGWEPQKPPRDVLPALFEFRNVNIQNVSAATALEAIGKRLQVPVLMDHNAMARHGIDPAKAAVSHPQSRTSYSLALRKILFQAGLKFELRVDEAQKPFLWVSTVKPV